MDTEEALNLIESSLGDHLRFQFQEELEESNILRPPYDATLIRDIGRAIQRWMERTGQ